ncbi:MAG: hypothetical protein AAFX51_19780 [Cyanobacteria bacterium J06636_28]
MSLSSEALGYDGRVGLESLPGAESFYEQRNMIRFEPEINPYVVDELLLAYFEYLPYKNSQQLYLAMINKADMGLRFMALLEITAEQILTLIQQLPAISKRTIFDFLRQELESSDDSDELGSIDLETQTWIEANLTEPLPTYEWDAEGIPEGLPVRHVPGKGVMIVETDES